MELPFEIYSLLEKIDDKPGILAAFAAFHPFALAILSIPLWLLNKFIFRFNLSPEKRSPLITGIIIIFTIGWLTGFFLMGLLTFSGISGVKMVLIYLALYLCITGFVMSCYREVVQQFENFSAKNNILKK